ncbi:MAG: DUF255 domain-containing protein [Pirellulales bacterium]|nr:DUF255 domain-containing protein [Pirellulales bacterium]
MRLRHGVCGFGITVAMLLNAGVASPIQWQPTLDAARAVAAQTNRLVLIHFWGDGCPPCARMDSDVFSRPEVADTIARNYVAVKVDRGQHPHIASQFGVQGVPADVIVTPQGRVIGTYVGAVPPQQFIGRLEQIASIHRGPPTAAHAQQAPVPSGAAWGAPPAHAVQPAPPIQAAPGPAYAAAPPPHGGTGNAGPAASPPIAAPANPRYSGQGQADYAPPAGYGSNPQPVAPAAYGPHPNAGPAGASAYPTEPRPAAHPATALGPGYPANPNGPSNMPAGAAQLGAPQASPPIASGAAAPFDGSAGRGPIGQVPAAAAPLAQPGTAQTAIPERMPPLALDGFCPVRLAREWRWVPGDPAWGAFHEGRTYLFAGPEEQQAFLNDPHRYAPVLSGRDVVGLVDEGRELTGTRSYGARWNDRIYLFNSRENYERFRLNPTLYESNISQNPVATVRPNYGTSMTARTPATPGNGAF